MHPNGITLPIWNLLPFSQNYTLRNLAEPGPNLLRLQVLPFGQFYGFYVECRTRKDGLGDENIPEEGVLVTLVYLGNPSPSLCSRHASAFAASNNPNNICDAPLQAGETHFTLYPGLSITNTGMNQDECSVQEQRRGPWWRPAAHSARSSRSSYWLARQLLL